MTDDVVGEADSSAVRVALWRALHVEVDPPPHVLTDQVGLQLAGPDDGWRSRPDMDPEGTKWFRAGIVARARVVEDLVVGAAADGVDQYVVLGAGLDTFAQRRTDLAREVRVFEVDRPAAVAWKRRRLVDLGFGISDRLRLVPVDFEAGHSWWDAIVPAGFDRARPSVVVATGVSMYLSRDANAATLRQAAALAPGSTFAMTFLLPTAQHDDALRPGFEAAERGARAAGTPFITFYAPEELMGQALSVGFRDARHVSADDLTARYFAEREDGLRVLRGEELLLAVTQ